jgi:hypothetical protein
MPQILENDVQIVKAGEMIHYAVSSCLTVTCGFGDGTMTGAHFSQGVREDRWKYDDSVLTWTVFLDTVKQQIKEHGSVTWVIVRGDLDGWNPAYLTTQAYQGGYAKRSDLRPTISEATKLDASAIDIATKLGDIIIDAGQVV